MRFVYGKNDWRTMRQGEENCYLLTNGLGGYSSLTVTGGNARNDHALLMASLQAPSMRYHMLTNIHGRVLENGREYDLASQRYAEGGKAQEGFRYLHCFAYEYLPEWRYQAGNVFVTQTVVMKQKENMTAVLYEVESAGSAELVLTPWMQFVPKGELLSEEQKFETDEEKIVSNGISMFYKTNGRVEIQETGFRGAWYYEQDERDGRDCVGRAAMTHEIHCRIRPGVQSFYVIYSLDPLPEADEAWVREMIAEEIRRQKELVQRSGLRNPAAQMLAKSANQYLSWRESTQGETIIAGYPFFGDWGRDTMIAMAGCTITAGQYESARSILRTFMAYCAKGLMPNMFPENGAEPIYNTVDAALLFIEVFYRYYQETKDRELLVEAYPVLKEILYWYQHGTDYGIYMDEDGLLAAGEGLYQLTWMDVRVGDILPTPRHGKPVEINAYWYNALRIMEELSLVMREDGSRYTQLAEQTRKSFQREFWEGQRGYLRDVCSGTAADWQIRCNQIWALTMSYTMVTKEQAQAVLRTVEKHLYTPWGLRSLSPDDPEYHPFYGGAQKDRDMAYHQGTVWAFPLGAYYRAVLRWSDSREEACESVKRRLTAMEACLREGCAGHIAEIYDGDRPDTSRGCFAQAWSVGEILRVYEEVEKTEIKKLEKEWIRQNEKENRRRS